jgi:hypothetical protein
MPILSQAGHQDGGGEFLTDRHGVGGVMWIGRLGEPDETSRHGEAFPRNHSVGTPVSKRQSSLRSWHWWALAPYRTGSMGIPYIGPDVTRELSDDVSASDEDRNVSTASQDSRPLSGAITQTG